MTAVVIYRLKTRKAAEKRVATMESFGEGLNYRLAPRDGEFLVVRDPHPSDASRNFETIEEA